MNRREARPAEKATGSGRGGANQATGAGPAEKESPGRVSHPAPGEFTKREERPPPARNRSYWSAGICRSSCASHIGRWPSFSRIACTCSGVTSPAELPHSGA